VFPADRHRSGRCRLASLGIGIQPHLLKHLLATTPIKSFKLFGQLAPSTHVAPAHAKAFKIIHQLHHAVGGLKHHLRLRASQPGFQIIQAVFSFGWQKTTITDCP